jgi:error-prone DNA polymerase
MAADRPDFPRMSKAERVYADYEATSLSLESHPVALVRDALTRRGAVTAAGLLEVPHGQMATVGGLVIVRQRPPTAKGFTFLSVEDETGIANLVIDPKKFERFRATIATTSLIVSRGRVERNGRVVNLKVDELEPLPLPEL